MRLVWSHDIDHGSDRLTSINKDRFNMLSSQY